MGNDTQRSTNEPLRANAFLITKYDKIRHLKNLLNNIKTELFDLQYSNPDPGFDVSPPKQIPHNIFSDYHLNELTTLNMRHRYLIEQRKIFGEIRSSLASERVKADCNARTMWVDLQLEDLYKKNDRNEIEIAINNHRKEEVKTGTTITFERKMIDLTCLKERNLISSVLYRFNVPIVNKKFFKLRNERTPSCHFDDDKRYWKDFGDPSKGGSVIDLYMELNNCNFITAIKDLNTLL